MIGIVGAMEQEVALLKQAFQDSREERAGPFSFIRGRYANRNVVLVQCGIGKVNAALGTGLMLERYGPSHVINTGSAGGLLSDQTMGDVVVSSEALYHDVDVTGFGYVPGQLPGQTPTFPADEALIVIAEAGLDRLRDRGEVPPSLKHTRGPVGTGDQFVHDPIQIAEIKKTFPTLACVEMEGAAIAQTCALWGVPFVIIRALSDIAGKESPLLFKDFLPLASQRSAGLVLEMIPHILEN